MSRQYVNHVLTNESVVVVFQDGVVPVPSDNPMYKSVVAALTAYKTDKLDELVDTASKIKKHSSGKFYVQDGLVMVDGKTLPNALSSRLISFANADLPVAPLLAFWDNLNQNPTKTSVDELYAFLEANHVPLTADGCFVGYKKVGANFKDLYSGRFDNSVGKVCKMDRSQVDQNRQNTCSTGLHVAAFDYAKNQYGGQSDPVVLVKVNPKDVVAVPPDYHQQKMRVAEYTVMAVYDGTAPLKQELYSTNTDKPATADEWGGPKDDEVGTVDEDMSDSVDEAVDENDPDLSASVSTDGQGRVCVPNAMIKHMGLTAGDEVFVLANDGEVVVSRDRSGTDDERIYTVDRDCNVRVSAGVLADADLDHRKTLNVDGWEDSVVLS